MAWKAKTWGLICVLFSLQTVGALVIQRLFHLNFNEVFIPVCLLILGTLVSFGFWSYSDSNKLGSWQWGIPVILYAAFIFSLSNRSYPSATPVFSTKIFHPIEYRCSVSSFAWPGSQCCPKKAFLLLLFLGILYGASDEFHQEFIPGRTPHVVDVLFCDLLGMTLGVAVFFDSSTDLA